MGKPKDMPAWMYCTLRHLDFVVKIFCVTLLLFYAVLYFLLVWNVLAGFNSSLFIVFRNLHPTCVHDKSAEVQSSSACCSTFRDVLAKHLSEQLERRKQRMVLIRGKRCDYEERGQKHFSCACCFSQAAEERFGALKRRTRSSVPEHLCVSGSCNLWLVSMFEVWLNADGIQANQRPNILVRWPKILNPNQSKCCTLYVRRTSCFCHHLSW